MKKQLKFALNGCIDAEKNLKDLEKAINQKFGTHVQVTKGGSAKAKRLMR